MEQFDLSPYYLSQRLQNAIITDNEAYAFCPESRPRGHAIKKAVRWQADGGPLCLPGMFSLEKWYMYRPLSPM